VAGWIAGTGLERPQRTALTLSSAISNNGNIGLPVAFFALGDAGLAAATVYYTISALLTNTFGVFVASAGTAPLRQAFSQSLRAPVLYATLVGLFCNRLSVPIPDSLYRAIDLLAGATIPIMLVLLGIQLSQTTLTRAQTVVWRSLLIRLGLSPAIALALCLWIGIGGVERQVMVLQAAMPTAVVATVLSTEFAAAPRLVAAAVLASTLVSVVTVSLLLAAIT
jgi:predicted permease